MFCNTLMASRRAGSGSLIGQDEEAGHSVDSSLCGNEI